MADPRTEPRRIQLNNAGVYIDWQDGHRSAYPHRFLRLQCRCAECINEWTKAPLLDPGSVPNDIRVIDYLPVGNYAYQFLFSDTHYTGIYRWDFLRSICPCPRCAPHEAEQGQ